MKRILKITGIAVFGIILIIIGFIYSFVFAGLPYQDPTPEIQANWSFHQHIADLFLIIGAFVLLLGLIAIPIIAVKTRNINSKFLP